MLELGPNPEHDFALARACARAHDLVGMLARAREHEHELAHTILESILALPQRYFNTNNELANSRIKDILYTLKSEDRDELAYNLLFYATQNDQSPQTKHEYLSVLHFLAPITQLPSELLEQIFLLIINDATQPSSPLMVVCRKWHGHMSSLWASLNLGTRTAMDAFTRKLERNPRLLDIVVDTGIGCGDLGLSKDVYEVIFAAIEVASRWRSVTIETFPGNAHFPEDLMKLGLQRCTDAAMSRLTTFRVMRACNMSPLLDYFLRILATTASEKLTTVEINSANVISFLLTPPYSPIFHSITVLHLETQGMRNPVDLLPHLHQLERLTASHLPLPAYSPDVKLTFFDTLRYLRLRSVSIQWMSGRTFKVLETCTLIFPHQHHSLHSFDCALPNCKLLTFEGYPLKTLNGFSVQKLTQLSVKSHRCKKRQRSWQLVGICNHMSGVLTLRSLNVGVEASSQAWIKALASMSNLEELCMSNLQPSSLHARFFEALLAKPLCNKDWDDLPATRKWHTTLCPSLKVFGLSYSRWLRSTEKFTFVPTMVATIWSRSWSWCPLQAFRIWLPSDQKEPLELIGASQIGLREFQLLCSGSHTEQGGAFDLVARKAVQKILRLPPLVHRDTRALRYGGDMHKSHASTQGKYFLTLPSSAVKRSFPQCSPLRLECGHLENEEDPFFYYCPSDSGSCNADYGSD